MKRIFKAVVILTMVLVMTAGSFGTAFGATLSVDAESAVIYCATTDEIIWQKNAGKEMNMASITKILTCLIAAEKLDLNKEVTVAKEATQVPLVEPMVREGEKIKVSDLMHMALMVSANDAAAALACEVAGGQKEFAKLMNAKAKELGCTNTNFVNASGVYHKDQHSTAKDIALIAAAAFGNPDVRRISGTREYTVPETNKGPAEKLKNLNLFLEGGELTINEEKTSAKKYKEVFAGKTGTTNENKATMAAGIEWDGLEIYAVVLGTTQGRRYVDMKKLFDYAKENVQRFDAFKKGDIFEEGSLLGGATNKVKGMAAADGILNLPEGASAALVSSKAVYNEELQAPVVTGQVIGRIDVYMGDEVVRTVDLLAAEDVEEGWFLSKWGITNLQTIFIIGGIVLVIGFVVLIMVLRSINKKKRAAARKAKLRKMALQQMENDHDHQQRNWPY